MKSLFDRIYEALAAGEIVWWAMLIIVASALIIALVVSLFRLHREIEDHDRFYVNEFDCQYLPRRR